MYGYLDHCACLQQWNTSSALDQQNIYKLNNCCVPQLHMLLMNMNNTVDSNLSSKTSVDDNPWYLTVRSFQTVIIPGVSVAGIVGNILAAGAFLTPILRQTSCCLYLASKAISDICFLFSLIVIWLYRIDVPVFKTEGICQATVFITYISSFLSVWFVVLITWENFIRVSLPRHVSKLCNVKRAKYTICILTLISFVIYSFSLWTTVLTKKNNDSSCLVLEKYETLIAAMTCVDSILTLIIPLIVMVFLNIAIAISAIDARDRQKRLLQNTPLSTVSKRRQSVLEIKVSKLLFAVSVIFILLHTPSHVIRIKMMVLKTIHMSEPNLSDMILHRIFELIYYLNFSLHIGVYIVFGEKFRLVFKRLYCVRCTSNQTTHSNDTHILSKRGSEAQTCETE